MKDCSVLIQTKVTPEASGRLDKICAEYGFSSKYEIIQYLVSAFLKYADPDAEPADADALPIELAKIFEDMQNHQEMINSVSPATCKQYKLSESINLYSVIGQPGIVAAKYTFSGNGDYMKTQNSNKILRTILSKLYPAIYRPLKRISASLGDVPLDESIRYLIDNADDTLKQDVISREVKATFAAMKQGEKHVDVGGIVPKQTRHKDINKM